MNYRTENNYNEEYKKTNVLLSNVFTRVLCFVLFFPALFDFDAAFGLRTMLDSNEVVSNHHPYLVQWIHAFFWRIGRAIGSPSIGMALLSVCYIIISIGIIQYVLRILQETGITQKHINTVGYLFAYFPLFPILSVYPTKDSFFAYAFLLYLITVYSLIKSNGLQAKKVSYIVVHFAAIVFLCFSRHQGIYIVILESIALVLAYRKYWTGIILSAVPAIIIYSLFINTILTTLNVEQVNKKEMYGMLFQQTAYYLKLYPNDVTEDELEKINAVVDADRIVKCYKPVITDDVKSCYVYGEGRDVGDNLLHFRHVEHSGEKEALEGYRKAWLSMFIKHPLCYVEATLAVVMGYFYNMGHVLIGFDGTWSNSQATSPQYAFYQFTFFNSLFGKISGYFSNSPIISFLFSIPYYIWAFFILLLIVIYRRDWKGLLLLFPIVLSIGVLLMSPVSCARYVYPIIFSLPILFTYLFQSNTKSTTYEKNSCFDSMLQRESDCSQGSKGLPNRTFRILGGRN